MPCCAVLVTCLFNQHSCIGCASLISVVTQKRGWALSGKNRPLIRHLACLLAAVAYKGRGNISSAQPSGQAVEQAAQILPTHQPSNLTQPCSSNHTTSDQQQQQQQEPQTLQLKEGLVNQEGQLHSNQHKSPTGTPMTTHSAHQGINAPACDLARSCVSALQMCCGLLMQQKFALNVH